ncbi:MAG: FtsX-like permease family protein [Clostridiaceae bacterium]
MRKNIFFLSAVRQPVKTILLFLLISLISFSFVSRTVEYVVVRRETERLGSYYRSIGMLKPTDPEQYYVTEGAALLEGNPYIAYTDSRRYCSGVLKDLYNADVGGYTSDTPETAAMGFFYGVHVSDVWFYGTLKYRNYSEMEGIYRFEFLIDQVEAGFPEYVKAGDDLTISLTLSDYGVDPAVFDAMEQGGRYLVRAFFDISASYSLDWTKASKSLFLKPLDDANLWYLSVPPGTSVNFDDPAVARVKENIDVLKQNLHSLEVTATADMSAMPSTQEVSRYYYLTDGRWLTRQDDLEQRNVCLVQQQFASIRGLSVGDTIRLTLRDFPLTEYGYITDKTTAWRDAPTFDTEFEIVGVYNAVPFDSSACTFYSLNIFIPNSCMPEGFSLNDEIYYNSYSFVLKSSRDQAAFLEETRDPLEQAGFTVSFVDSNVKNFWASVDSLAQTAQFGAAVWGCVLVLSLALAAFLYSRQRRREFAILRALGAPSSSAARQMLSPMLLLGGAGIALGGGLSWRYALDQAMESLKDVPLPEGAEPAANLSPLWVIGLCAGIFALLLGFVWVGTRLTVRKPVLELLQRSAGGTTAKAKRSSAAMVRSEETAVTAKRSRPMKKKPLHFSPLPKDGSPAGAAGGYLFRHIVRSPLKSLLTFGTALLFVLAMGWMDGAILQNRSEIDRLYRTTIVEMDVLKGGSTGSIIGNGGGFITQKTIDAILQSGFIQSFELEEATVWPAIAPKNTSPEVKRLYDKDRAEIPASLYAFDHTDAFFAGSGVQTQVTYADGWDETLFAGEWTKERLNAETVPVVLPERLLTEMSVQLGDEVYLVNLPDITKVIVAGSYSGYIFSADTSEPVLMPLSLLKTLVTSQEVDAYYTKAHFVIDPAKNSDLPAFRETVKAIVEHPGAGLLDLNAVVWDEELRMAIAPLEKNLDLMRVLFPVTIALSALIAGGLSLLLLLQNAREAALMRVLGMKKRKVRTLLNLEQLFISLIGALAGLLALAVLRQSLSAAFSATPLLCAGLYLIGSLIGSILASVMVSNRMPLELLQVKE